jgi:hypothetical protein
MRTVALANIGASSGIFGETVHAEKKCPACPLRSSVTLEHPNKQLTSAALVIAKKGVSSHFLFASLGWSDLINRPGKSKYADVFSQQM